MANEHWFDVIVRAVILTTSRREVIWAVVTAFSAPFGIGHAYAGKKKHRKKKGKGKGGKKGKGGGSGSANGTCSGGACKDVWPSSSTYDTDNRNHCEFICHQCDGADPREFCLIEEHVTHKKIAVCCEEDTVCCNTRCCGDTRFPGRWQCCNDSCRDTNADAKHCGRCSNPCGEGEVCEAGVCVCAPGVGRSARSAGCNPPCLPNEIPCGSGCCPDHFRWSCCDDNTCRWVGGGDVNNCGACDAFCPLGQYCENGGFCTCGENNTYCSSEAMCIDQGNICCGNIVNGCLPDWFCCPGVGESGYCSPTPCP